jgi:hypothetical protein
LLGGQLRGLRHDYVTAMERMETERAAHAEAPSESEFDGSTVIIVRGAPLQPSNAIEAASGADVASVEGDAGTTLQQQQLQQQHVLEVGDEGSTEEGRGDEVADGDETDGSSALIQCPAGDLFLRPWGMNAERVLPVPSQAVVGSTELAAGGTAGEASASAASESESAGAGEAVHDAPSPTAQGNDNVVGKQ